VFLKSFFSKFGETACFLPKSFSQMAIVKQLVKDLYCSQERSVREEQTE
jgi:pantothenate synthetase